MRLGDHIKFSKCYATKLSERLVYIQTQNSTDTVKTGLVHLTKQKEFNGIVIGVRCVGMEGVVYYPRSYDEENCEQAHVSFTPEKCYLVAFNLYRKPVLVRLQDIVL